MRAFAVFSLSLLLAACLQQETDNIRAENGWIAEIPPMINVTAALMILHNDGDKPRYLIGASSPNTDSIEVHKSIIVNDLAKMIRQLEVEIPPQGSIEFSNETGYHLMLYGSRGMKAGQKIPISLEFKDGTSLTIDYEVVDRRKIL